MDGETVLGGKMACLSKVLLFQQNFFLIFYNIGSTKQCFLLEKIIARGGFVGTI